MTEVVAVRWVWAGVLVVVLAVTSACAPVSQAMGSSSPSAEARPQEIPGVEGAGATPPPEAAEPTSARQEIPGVDSGAEPGIEGSLVVEPGAVEVGETLTLSGRVSVLVELEITLDGEVVDVVVQEEDGSYETSFGPVTADECDGAGHVFALVAEGFVVAEEAVRFC